MTEQSAIPVGPWLVHHACPQNWHVAFVQSMAASRAQVGRVVVVVVLVVVVLVLVVVGTPQ